MTDPTTYPTMLVTIIPEIALALVALVLLFLDLIWKKRMRSSLGWVTVAGLLTAAITSAVFFVPQNGGALIWGGMLRLDAAGAVFRVLFILGASITALLSIEEENLFCCGEFYFLLVVSTLGLTMLAAASDLIMVFLALETASVPLYILAGFRYKDSKSVEAGLKYLLYGAMASTIMLFGFTFLYGFSGTTQLYEIGAAIRSGNIPPMAAAMAGLLVLAGLGFKVSAVPFHFWAPDVYEGAPTAISGFLSTASKAGGFAVLLRFTFAVFPALSEHAPLLIGIMAAASMLIGNIMALSQKNFKRFLAYSSIAQAGYILVGVASFSRLGATGTVYYLMAYLATNLAAFGIAFLSGRASGTDDISGLAGLSRRSPMLGMALLVSLLSLGGIPPFAGFIGKVMVFSAAMQSGMTWLAVVAVLNSVLSLYYYLRILKVAFLEKPPEENHIFKVSPVWQLAFFICLAGIFVLGVVILPWFNWASSAASSLVLY